MTWVALASAICLLLAAVVQTIGAIFQYLSTIKSIDAEGMAMDERHIRRIAEETARDHQIEKMRSRGRAKAKCRLWHAAGRKSLNLKGSALLHETSYLRDAEALNKEEKREYLRREAEVKAGAAWEAVFLNVGWILVMVGAGMAFIVACAGLGK